MLLEGSSAENILSSFSLPSGPTATLPIEEQLFGGIKPARLVRKTTGLAAACLRRIQEESGRHLRILEA